ncbi:hypothetical protein JW948_11765 [bacterium]|nr:hypothetical protein [bacterium]
MNTEFENYPFRMILCANLVSLTVYALGIYIFMQWGTVWGAAFLIYCLLMEINLYRKGCAHCWYYGKNCCFGRGKIAALFFKKGDPDIFKNRTPDWKELLPDILLLIMPLAAGTVLLIRHFTWMPLAAMIVIVLLSFFGNALIRGSMACSHCVQKRLGCPAEKLFNKTAS